MPGFSWRVKQYASARMAVGIKKERQKEKKAERTDREIIKIRKMQGQKLYTDSPFGSLYKKV